MMPASSKPTEENWNPSSLLVYNTLPGHQDFDSTISDAKSTADARADFYDRSLTSRRYALVGLSCSYIFSCLCIIAGISTLANHGISGVTPLNIFEYRDVMAIGVGPIQVLPLRGEILTLILDLFVTLCTESIGFVHGISLRSVLASESRLRFNTNLRLLTAARGWYNPNSAFLNGISAVLLIISYSAASLVVCQDFWMTPAGGSSDSISIAGFPLLILGVALLLQMMIALSAMQTVKILTWSSSPFDLTAALVHHAQLTPATFRCMCRVSDIDIYGGPAKPPGTQPSAWHAHPSIRKVVISLWVIVAACAGWAVLVMYFWDHFHLAQVVPTSPLTLQTWSFLRNLMGNYVIYDLPGVNLTAWIVVFVFTAVVQGPLTLGLHCSELIVNVIRDERQWRCATKRKGLSVATNPLKPIFIHPMCLILFITKPFLHWMFGLSFSLALTAFDENINALVMSMFTAQIWNLCIALFIFSCFFTFITLR
ncbi:uncharacterized protein F5891DRAFT_120214 [Suillus fuscotomentosus]|uniref:Uncharacterized protein n=1 Tax=Suillus fuscotomentosus TaxID=1912939 RepID=A0AAD4HC78_9AGAM|nr:uncharacterized protein F5891DRAFT_120214 [Suillus fuscotomentosus]KAG1890555.1 hypothetical protein F5891DRAFT_120214 [Suillus fuscotomentosus]